MEKNTKSFNLGKKGIVIVILAFFSIYVYSALTSDSLNVTIGVFGEMGLDTNVLYSLATVATILGIIGSILFGKLMNVKTASLMWGLSMIGTGIFSVIWSFTTNEVIYAIGYLVCYVLTLVSAMLLSFQVIANWFPKKRGIAVGIATAGYPLSAATTTAISSAFVGAIGIQAYYIFIAAIAFIVGIVVLLFAKDFPEEKNCYPDNNCHCDIEGAKKEHLANLEYLKNSKWTVLKCLTTGRMWILWMSVSIVSFLSMGIMSNFVGKFMEAGYDLTTILGMLGIAGVIAIPGSMFVGWLDVTLGTKKTGILVNVFAFVAICFNLTDITVLHYISLPILACELGGASNILLSSTAAIWGRYDFQAAFRVIQPLNAIMTGVGITVVGIIGTNFSYYTAYAVMAVMALVGIIASAVLKVEPIDKDVR